MSKKSSDWYVPPDIVFLFSIYIALPIVAAISGVLFPILTRFKTGDLLGVFYLALALGAVGTVLLFFARLPLYRKRQFLSFGPRQLTGIHRKLYWVAYLFVAVSILLLVLIWLRLR
jgi:archaellum biogenesis protein FlaJ (TadC family)